MVWGAIAGTALSCVLGAIWYSRYFLGNPWMSGTFPGKTYDQILKGASQFALPMSLISQALLVVIMQYILSSFHITGIENHIKVALTLAIIELLIDVQHCAFSQRSVVAFLIDHGYNMGVLVIMAVCVAYLG